VTCLEEAPSISPNLLAEENIKHIEHPISYRLLTHRLESTRCTDGKSILL